MSLYLPVRSVGGTVAVAICPRCQCKIYQGELRKDPNNEGWYCKGCVDTFDPWRKPVRRPEDIATAHPRPDVELI